MSKKLIIIRGDSGSGKSTVAKKLQRAMGKGTMLVPQDVIRREIVCVEDGPNNPAIQLIEDTATYGRTIGYDVIVEGILSKKNYGVMLQRLIEHFEGNVFAYYFDIPFEETVRRHQLKPNAHEFGVEEMRAWRHDHDVLGLDENEKIITEDMTEDDIIAMMITDIQGS